MNISANSEVTILLVDDNPLNNSTLINHLLDQSYQLMVVSSGSSVLTRMPLCKPDLILLDVSIPSMNGFETCRRIKGDPDSAEIPIIFLSPHTEQRDKIKGFNAGGIDYLTKPINLAEVAACMKKHLQTRHIHKIHDEIHVQKTSEIDKELLPVHISEQRGSKSIASGTGYNLAYDHSQLQQVATRLSGVRRLLDSIAHPVATTPQHNLINKQAHEAIRLFDEAEQIYSSIPTVSQSSALSVADYETAIASLSEREGQVFKLIVAGLSIEEIARHTHIAASTVRTYKVRIMRKLNVSNVPDLVRLAMLTTINEEPGTL